MICQNKYDKIIYKQSKKVIAINIIDISHSNLYIGKIINVIKSQNTNHHKLLTVDSRHSDAFVYIIYGSCTYQFDDGLEFTVKAGDVLYLAHRSVYTMYIHTNDYKFIFCDFDFTEAAVRKSAVYSVQNAQNIENIFNKLLNRYNSPTKNSHSECMAILYNIYGIIQNTAERTYIAKNAKAKIIEAQDFIDSNFKDRALSVSMLAERAGVSEVYFRKLFKSQFNISPSQYITSVRLENAKKLMKYPFLSIEECALQSGFSSLQYFCRVFKKETGISPGKYIKSAEHF